MPKDQNSEANEETIDTSVPEFKSRSKSQIYRRFAPILNSMHRHLAEHTFHLRKLVDIQSEHLEIKRLQLDAQEEETEAAARRGRSDELRENRERPRRGDGGGGGSSDWLSSFTGAFSGGALGSTDFMGLVDIAKSIVLGGAALAIMSGPVREFTNTFMRTTLEGMGIAIKDGSIREEILNEASAALPGAIGMGMLFGRKAGIGYMIVSTLVGSVSDSVRKYFEGEKEGDGKYKVLGYELDEKDVTAIETAVKVFGAFALPFALKGVLGVGRLFVAGLNFAGILDGLTLGEAGKLAVRGFARSAIGAIFGPVGLTAIAVGVVGMAIKEVADYTESKKQEFRDNLNKHMDKMDKTLKEGLPELKPMESWSDAFAYAFGDSVDNTLESINNMLDDQYVPSVKGINTDSAIGGSYAFAYGRNRTGEEVETKDMLPSEMADYEWARINTLADRLAHEAQTANKSGATIQDKYPEDKLDPTVKMFKGLLRNDIAARNSGKPYLTDEQHKSIRTYLERSEIKTTEVPAMVAPAPEQSVKIVPTDHPKIEFVPPQEIVKPVSPKETIEPEPKTDAPESSFQSKGLLGVILGSNSTTVINPTHQTKSEKIATESVAALKKESRGGSGGASFINAPVTKGGNSQTRGGDTNTTINNYRLSSLSEDRALPFVS